MELLKLLNSRKATRAISPEPLSDEIIEKLMQAGQLAPSCFNKQPWRFLFLSEQSALEKGRKALSSGNNWAKAAPLLIIGFSRPDFDCQFKDGRSYYLFDLGLAVENIILQATELNLVCRPMAGFDPQIIQREFALSDGNEVVVMLAVGKEGDITKLDEKLRERSSAPRVRNPIEKNFALNEIDDSAFLE